MSDEQSILDDLEESLNAIDLEELPQRSIEQAVLDLARAGIKAHQLYRQQIRDAINSDLDRKNRRRQRIVTKRDTYAKFGEKPPSEKVLLAYVEDDDELKQLERTAELAAGMRDATLEEIRTLRTQTNAFQSLLADLRALVGAP